MKVQGYDIDISNDDLREIFRHPDYRITWTRSTKWSGTPYMVPALEFMYKGEWWTLARTDLKDDVCTTRPQLLNDVKVLADPIEMYRKDFYGARLKRHDDGRLTFAVIDSFSDG